MRDADWSREILLRSDWLLLIVASMTTRVVHLFLYLLRFPFVIAVSLSHWISISRRTFFSS